MKPTTTYQRIRIATMALLGLAALNSFGGEAPIPVSTAPVADPVRMDTFEVSAVPIEQQVLPTTRPFNSVFGTDMSILDTPRNVTIISREQMNVIGIQETRDFSKLTASSYTQTNFGLPSNPSIRGQTADVLVNGMRRGLTVNGNGMPVNFNAVESVNIVKGTASVIYGATSYTGGYADFITKKPTFDKFRGSFAATVGMYDQYRWTVDMGGPVSKKFAYRLSYSGEESGSYYYGGKKNTQALYGAIEWHPNENYTLEVNAEGYVADFTENWGINRVTQQLIDDGYYIPDALTDAQYVAFTQTVGGFGNPVQAYGTPVKLDRRRRLLSPGDDSYGINITAQVVQTLKLGDEAKLVNNTFFNYVDRDTFSSYYYASVHKDNYGLENRLQYTNKVKLGSIDTSYAAGFSARYQSVWAADDFFHEPINSWDITRDGNLNRVPASSFGGFNASVLVPGFGPRGALPGVYVTPGANYPVVFPNGVFTQYNGGGSSNDSTLKQLSPFYQQNFIFSEKFSLLAGGRIDYMDVENTDPVPPPGFAPVSDSISVSLPSYNGSAVYKFTNKWTGYYTYSFVTSTESISLGGGYAFLDTSYGGDARQFYDFQFDKKNTLHEFGLKGSLLENKLFIGIALYDQQQKWNTLDGLQRFTKSKGFEIEANYQPNRKLFATISYSYFDSEQRYAGFLADSIVYDKRLGSAVPFTPDFPSISDPFEQPGMPKHLVNFLVNYKFTPEFSASIGTVFTGEIVTSQVGNGVSGFGVPVVLSANVIPWQYTTDVTLAYQGPRWNARLSLMNVTNEKNWSAPNPGYGNGAINAELPFRAEITVGFKF